MSSCKEEVVSLLTKYKKTVSTAESLTGGLLSAEIVSVSGASNVFETGFVTYAEKTKMKELSVKKETLEKYTVVSRACALEMASGCLRRADSDYAVTTTGIAGPTGGTTLTPVGTVFIGVSSKQSGTEAYECHFEGNRDEIRRKAVEEALRLLLEIMKKELCS